jgi:hypothetical protein
MMQQIGSIDHIEAFIWKVDFRQSDGG